MCLSALARVIVCNTSVHTDVHVQCREFIHGGDAMLS